MMNIHKKGYHSRFGSWTVDPRSTEHSFPTSAHFLSSALASLTLFLLSRSLSPPARRGLELNTPPVSRSPARDSRTLSTARLWPTSLLSPRIAPSSTLNRRSLSPIAAPSWYVLVADRVLSRTARVISSLRSATVSVRQRPGRHAWPQPSIGQQPSENSPPAPTSPEWCSAGLPISGLFSAAESPTLPCQPSRHVECPP